MKLLFKLAQAAPEWLNELQYGNVSQKHIQKLEEPHPLIPLLPEELTRIDPPPNDSDQTREELREIVRHIRTASEHDIKYMEKIDKDVLYPFRMFFQAQGMAHDFKSLEQMMDQINVLTLSLKMEYQRPRPFQLAHSYMIPLYPHTSGTPHTPAYPSGHAAQGYLAAYVLGDQYPDYAEQLERLGHSIARSRLVGGWHFPSDTEYARLLALQVADVLRGRNAQAPPE